tara:strand:+ start:14427 stop:15200 length:774 start_codon:yes stop_codon:yes gene_type:complete
MDESYNMRPILLPKSTKLNWANVYRKLATKDDIHAITQREDAEKTDRIMNSVIGRLPATRTILDIGCGDGRLLRDMNAEVRVGTVISEEEVVRLRTYHEGEGIEFVVADIETLNLGRPFDLICAVGVLSHLQSKKAVRRAMQAIWRSSANDGHLYVGVLPQIEAEPKRHRSTMRAIGFVRRTCGVKVMLGFIWHLWKRRHRMGFYEAPRLPQYAASADAFISLADECGFDLVDQWRCADVGTDDDRQRMDYLFRRRS